MAGWDPSRMQARAGLLASLMAVFFGLVVLRLLDLQVLRRPGLVAKAERQQFVKVEVPGQRGSITDRHGQVLVESVGTESVFVSTGLIKPKQRAKVARALAQTLGVNEMAMRRKLDSGRPFFAAHNAKLEATAALRKHRIGALSYQLETKRVHPQGSLAAHVLGFAGRDDRGLEGVERSYDKALAGRSGVKELLRDAAGRRIANQEEWIKRPKRGHDLRLTLDAQLQHIAERELEKAYHKFSAKGAALVLMDPHSGEILALASQPSYDPAAPARAPMDARRNRAVSDAFEPGSTFKAVTAALALKHRVVTPDSIVDCHDGKKEYFRRIVRDHGDEKLGRVPFSTVMAHSSNIGTVEVALKFGPRRLYDGMRAFGFGRPTGVDLPGEVAGLLRPLERWTPGSMAAIPFGQEFSSNLLQTVVAYAAVANGGYLVRPHVVKELRSPGGSVTAVGKRQPRTRVISEGVRRQLVPMLQHVVDEGTGVAIALPGYSIAGKTGTAQKFDLERGRYSQTDNVSTFVGFVPADKPAFVAAVMLDEPRGITLGGWNAGPVFRAVASAALTAYNVPPNEDVLDAQLASARRAKEADGAAKSWSTQYRRGAKAAAVRQVKVPDLHDLSLAQARQALAEAGLRLRATGKGRVTAQYPEAGEGVLENSTVSVSLEAAAKPSDRAAAPAARKGG
jgi:cell division protein FtsI (penicillin-binding protein 3)